MGTEFNGQLTIGHKESKQANNFSDDPTIPGKTHTGNFERRNKSHNVLNVITNAFQITAFSLKYSWKYIC